MTQLKQVAALAIVAAGTLVPLACSNSDSAAGPTGPAGGPVSGAVDDHCSVPTKKVQATNDASCHPPDAGPTDSGATEGGTTDSAAPSDSAPPEESAPTMNNAEGDDDDCKYHVKFTSTAVYKNQDVTFTVTTTKKTDSSAAKGAATYIEAFLDETHPAPKAGTTTETAPGVYSIGPVRFDASGKWTVRFHFFGDCVDGEDSPHGHAAFFVNVP